MEIISNGQDFMAYCIGISMLLVSSGICVFLISRGIAPNGLIH